MATVNNTKRKALFSSIRKQQSQFLHLSLRRDSTKRSVNIRLTYKALGLVIWIGLGMILLYEIVWVMVKLLLRRSRWLRQFPCWRQGSCCHVARTTTTANKLKTDDLSYLPTHHDDDKSSSADKQTRYMHLLLTDFLPTLTWGISTVYGVFYSFEMLFLYVNDEWYQLLLVQSLFSFSDIFTWCCLVAQLKYSSCCTVPAPDQQQQTSWPCVEVCAAIKVQHLLFNLFLERGVWTGRHVMFLLEDSTYIWLMCREPGVKLSWRRRWLPLSSAVTVMVLLLQTKGRIT